VQKKTRKSEKKTHWVWGNSNFPTPFSFIEENTAKKKKKMKKKVILEKKRKNKGKKKEKRGKLEKK
jgi:hypothetical protein